MEMKIKTSKEGRWELFKDYYNIKHSVCLFCHKEIVYGRQFCSTQCNCKYQNETTVSLGVDKNGFLIPDPDRAARVIRNNKMSRIKSIYGLTSDSFDAISKIQRQRCLICNKISEVLHVDHNHKTGKVRGFLCKNCNTGIGFLQESRKNLINASLYVSDKIPKQKQIREIIKKQNG